MTEQNSAPEPFESLRLAINWLADREQPAHKRGLAVELLTTAIDRLNATVTAARNVSNVLAVRGEDFDELDRLDAILDAVENNWKVP